MKIEETIQHSFKVMNRTLGHDRPADSRPMWQLRLSAASPFCRALVGCGYMTELQMQEAVVRYRLGMSRDQAVIFWQIDHHDVVHDGKLMYYRDDCHRDHDRKPTWVSYLLRRSGQLPGEWQSNHCLFGLHQLTTTPHSPVAVVESEKTAVIMSAIRPEYVWMATGGKTELSVAKLKPLENRRVILFPDTDPDGQTYREWFDVAVAAADVFGHPVSVSSLLEQQATARQKAAKIDVADLLFPDKNHQDNE